MQLPRVIAGLARSTHPGPTVAVTMVGSVVGFAVGLDTLRIGLVALTILTNQLSIGLSNDWLDAARDRAVGRTDKPIARGDVSIVAVRGAAIVTLAVSLATGFFLGTATGLANLLFVSCGWLYNVGLKSSLASTLMYAIAFGALPAIATFALPSPAAPAVWAIALGALLGVAAHFANVLPDLDDDRRTGIRALPHILGPRRAGVFTFVVLAAASVIALIGPRGDASAVQWVGAAACLGIAAAGTALVLTRPPTRALFRLIMAAALVDVVVLAAAGERMLA